MFYQCTRVCSAFLVVGFTNRYVVVPFFGSPVTNADQSRQANLHPTTDDRCHADHEYRESNPWTRMEMVHVTRYVLSDMGPSDCTFAA